ncbi:MAG: coproporphyrinogen-III oxidase family protein [Phycisphaeraceae bacterium]
MMSRTSSTVESPQLASDSSLEGKSNGLPWSLQDQNSFSRSPIDGLYLHIPFCFHKCHYCDFYSIVDEEKGQGPGARGQAAESEGETISGTGKAIGHSPTSPPARGTVFVDRMIVELRELASRFTLSPRTIFVGGGTPTLLPSDQWQRLLDAMKSLRLLDRVSEFTVEANPETVTLPLMQTLARGGVNRVSLGAQSFQPALLATLERWHDPSSVAKAVHTVREAGITNTNLDLIFAIPGQTMAMLDADLDAALSLAPSHLSCYSLIFEPNTAMTQRLKMGQVAAMDEETERTMYEHVIRRLATAGFEHYEVSNWARRSGSGLRVQGSEFADTDPNSEPGTRNPEPPRRCLHNLIYWLNANWLGAGPAAASHVAGHRWKNVPHLGQYLAKGPLPPTMDHEHLPADRSLGEQLMLRLRLLEGASHDWLNANLPADDARRKEIDSLVKLDMLERTSTHTRLTAKGLFVADAVLTRLL